MLCIQRGLTDVRGAAIEPQELPLPPDWTRFETEPLLLLAGARLLLGLPSYRRKERPPQEVSPFAAVIRLFDDRQALQHLCAPGAQVGVLAAAAHGGQHLPAAPALAAAGGPHGHCLLRAHVHAGPGRR